MITRHILPVLLALQFAGTAAAAEDPIALYGNEIRFDIVRKGETVGQHIVTFARAGEEIQTRSDVQIAINFLFFSAFRYHYQSEAVWTQGQLQRLAVDIRENARAKRLTAVREGEHIAVSGPSTYIADAATHPTEHWNAQVLDERSVLNTITGRLNNVVIESVGREYVATERGSIPATRYRYTGDLATEVWYDDAGRWVKMRFKGRDGSDIEYVCRKCQGAEAQA